MAVLEKTNFFIFTEMALQGTLYQPFFLCGLCRANTLDLGEKLLVHQGDVLCIGRIAQQTTELGLFPCHLLSQKSTPDKGLRSATATVGLKNDCSAGLLNRSRANHDQVLIIEIYGQYFVKGMVFQEFGLFQVKAVLDAG